MYRHIQHTELTPRIALIANAKGRRSIGINTLRHGGSSRAKRQAVRKRESLYRRIRPPYAAIGAPEADRRIQNAELPRELRHTPRPP